jgi:hypothetical protein
VIDRDVIGRLYQADRYQRLMATRQHQALNTKVRHAVLAAVRQGRASIVDPVMSHRPEAKGIRDKNKERTLKFVLIETTRQLTGPSSPPALT